MGWKADPLEGKRSVQGANRRAWAMGFGEVTSRLKILVSRFDSIEAVLCIGSLGCTRAAGVAPGFGFLAV